MNYQFYDWDSFNYNLYMLDGTGFLRGPDPRPLPAGRYLSVIGAADAFGRFVERPYADQIGQRLRLPVANMGVSAAGPGFFAENVRLLDIINGGAACVVNLMSARSSENSQYTNLKTRKNLFQPVADGPDAPFLTDIAIFSRLWGLDRELAFRLIEESQQTWLRDMALLISRIKVPSVVMWFSSRGFDLSGDTESYVSYASAFPQLVNRAMVETAASFGDAFVEVTGGEGLPVPFENRFTGAPGRCFFGTIYRESHGYYPSQAMHDAAAVALEPALRKVLAGKHLLTKRSVRASKVGGDTSPHARMIAIASAAALAPRDPEPFAMVSLLSAINTFHDMTGTRGRVEVLGDGGTWLGDCLRACDTPQADATALRLLLVGHNLVFPAEALDRLQNGAAILLRGAVGPAAARAPVAAALAAGLQPLALFDDMLLCGHGTSASLLLGRISAFLNERYNPGWKASSTRYLATETFPLFQSRRWSDHMLAHAITLTAEGLAALRINSAMLDRFERRLQVTGIAVIAAPKAVLHLEVPGAKTIAIALSATDALPVDGTRNAWSWAVDQIIAAPARPETVRLRRLGGGGEAEQVVRIGDATRPQVFLSEARHDRASGRLLVRGWCAGRSAADSLRVTRGPHVLPRPSWCRRTDVESSHPWLGDRTPGFNLVVEDYVTDRVTAWPVEVEMVRDGIILGRSRRAVIED